MHLGANLEEHGLSAAPDWRYDLVCDYLKASPSYEAVRQAIRGKKHPLYPLPTDAQAVHAVMRDFGDIYKIREADWWTSIGMQLFGVAAPLPETKLAGHLTKKTKSLSLAWPGNDSVVLTLPLALSLSQALKQAKSILKSQNFSMPTAMPLKPKYSLTKSKLTRKTLQNGLTALRLYKSRQPLWRIGNMLELVPTLCFDESEHPADHLHKYAANKEVLSIAASRLIKTAALIAENAARGRFPSSQPFTEAVLNPYKRPAGRPVGSKAPKRKKADSASRGFKSGA